MRISSVVFNRNHLNELYRYTSSHPTSIHLISKKTNLDRSELKKYENIVLIEENELLEALKREKEKYDLIIITDLFELTDDIYTALKRIQELLNKDGKLLITSVNPKWNSILSLFEYFKLKTVTNKRAYIHPKKISNIARSSGFEINQFYSRQIFPFKIFGIGTLFNKVLELFAIPLNLGIKNYIVFGKYTNITTPSSKSIIIPAKNEEKNLVPLIERIPKFDEDYELIVVYGDSKDNTEKVALSLNDTFPNIKINAFKQSRDGKANAVWEAVEASKNDFIAILDSDQSVDPETLLDFFEILENGNADFVNGTRLIYPMEDNAMRLINTFGNKVFQFLISIVIGQKLTDSLCGTKVFKKTNLEKIYNWQNTLNSKDPFGDFDLIFSSAFAGDKILEYPVHYIARIYGETQISRFKDGYKLIKYFIESFYLFNFTK